MVKMKDKLPKDTSAHPQQTRSKQKEERDFYQKLVEHSLQGIVIFQNNGIVFANKTMEDIAGFSVDELLSFSPDQVRDFIHPDDRAQVWKRMRERLQGKDVPSRYVFRALRKDNKYNWLEMYAALIEYQGKPAVQGAIVNITEQKQAEAELLKREATLNSIFKAAPIGIGLVSNSILLRVNEKICEMAGYSQDELVGKSARILYPTKKDYDYVTNENHRQISEFGTGTVETRWKIKSGEIKDVLLSSTLLDQGDLSAGVTFTALDITESKRTLDELKNSEERLKILFEFAPDAYYLIDLTGRFLDGNKAAEALIGYSKEELIGKSFLKLNPMDKALIKKAAALLSRNASGMATGPDEFVLRRLDGSQVFVEISTYPVKINDKIQVLGIARDVSEQHKAIEALRTSEDKFRNLAEKSPNMIFINKRGRVVYANKKCEESMGYSVEEFLSSDFNFFSLIAPESMEFIKKSLSRHLRGEDVPPYEYSLVTKNGKRIDAIITTKLIPYEDDTAILGIITDITERKQAEEKIKASLKEKEVMLREIHHRVKNNMQIITSLLRLQAGQDKDANVQQMFTLCQNRIKSMSLIHESLYQSQVLSRINFSDYIKKMTTHLVSIYSQGKKVFSVNYELDDVYLDINQAIPFGLIINELITNALQHAFPPSHTGDIMIALRKEKKGKIIFEVKDNGVGIPEDVNTERPISLGLQLVYDLARQLNGSVNIRNKPGTSVTISF